MEKTKKNGILKTAACIFGGTMLMTCVLGGTLAKYASTKTVDMASSVTAAEWEINVNNTKLDELTNAGLSFTITNDGAQANEQAYTAKPAPGTYGYAPITIKNNGDVDAYVKLEDATLATYDDAGLTLGLTTTPPDGSPISNDSTIASTGVLVKAKDTTGTTVYVAYDWPHDDAAGAKDAGDTALAGGAINFGSIKLTAEQAKYTA